MLDAYSWLVSGPARDDLTHCSLQSAIVSAVDGQA